MGMNRRTTVAIAAVLAGGALLTWWMVVRADRELRKNLLEQTQLVAQTVNLDRVRALTGTEADLNAPDYLRLKEQFARIKAANDRCRFVYLMGRQTDGQIFFFVDNEPVGSENESPAGQVYEEASPEYHRAFDTRAELVEGPITDRWGTWISSLTPLTDPQTGELIAVLGMDVDARTWSMDVAASAILPVTLMLTLLIVLGAGLVSTRLPVKACDQPVQGRLLVPLAAALLLLVGGCGAVLLHIQKESLNESSRLMLKEASNELELSLADQSKTMEALEKVLLSNVAVADALKAQDRDRLLAAYESDFEYLLQEHGITHFYFHGPDRVNLLRMHKPERHGDLIDRFTACEAERTGKTASGIELGPLGTFTLRVVRPVFDDDTLIGYLELGKEVEDILVGIQNRHNSELAVAILKNSLKREKWEAGMRMLGREADWDRFPEDALIYSSLSSFPVEAERFVSEAGHTHRDVTATMAFRGKTWRVLVVPLIDVSGVEVGNLLVFNDISEPVAQFNRLLAVTFGMTLVLLTSLLSSLYVLLRRVDQGILAREEVLSEKNDALVASYDRIRELTESITDILWSYQIDATGVLIEEQISKQADEILGLEKGTIGNSFEDYFSFIYEEDLPVVMTTFEQTLKEPGNVREVEYRHVLPDGETRVQSRGTATVLSDGAVKAYGRTTDITAQKRAEEEMENYSAALESANKALEEFGEAAEAANRSKSAFLANMSHEIRTPMTAILGFTDVLLGEDGFENAPPDRAATLETIKRNGEYLLELINDILDLSKIEAGKVEIERITCSPSKVVADVASLMRVRAEAKGLPLEIEYVGGIPESILCDPTRLRQILINLVGNAIKFTEIGNVRLQTRLVQNTARPPSLLFDVIDTGIGMTQKQASKLFQPFTQVDASTTRKFGGTGLGLTISKRLAELLGGDITIGSEPGKGSTFSVAIETGPLDDVSILENITETVAKSRQKAKVATAPAVKLDCRILLAEDGPDNQRLITFVLKKAGADVTLAENGLIARDKALAAREVGEPFDVILMDMQMPVMDGYTATRKLREADYTGRIIALTANAMAGDDEKCRDAGCDGYATKPIDRAKLFGTIAQFLGQDAATIGASAASDA